MESIRLEDKLRTTYLYVNQNFTGIREPKRCRTGRYACRVSFFIVIMKRARSPFSMRPYVPPSSSLRLLCNEGAKVTENNALGLDTTSTTNMPPAWKYIYPNRVLSPKPCVWLLCYYGVQWVRTQCYSYRLTLMHEDCVSA